MDVATTDIEVVREAFEALEPDEIHMASFDSLVQACRENLQSVDEEMLLRAFKLSNWAHRDDTRASGHPYIRTNGLRDLIAPLPHHNFPADPLQ